MSGIQAIMLAVFFGGWQAPLFAHELSLDGTPIDVRVSSLATRTIVFEATSSGKSSQPLHLLAAAPPGATLRVEAQQVTNNRTPSPWVMEFAVDGRFRPVLPFSRTDTPSKLKTMRERYPGESDAEIEARFGLPMHELLRNELTTERAYLDIIESRTLLQRDSCRSTAVRLRVIVDLSAVEDERYLGDFIVAVSLTALPASSDQRTLYKPYSERSRSLAVILLALTRATGNVVLLTKWRAGRPAIVRSSALRESPYFGNGGLYARYYLPRSKHRDGITVERVSIDANSIVVDAYGVCLRLNERRQQVHGFR